MTEQDDAVERVWALVDDDRHDEALALAHRILGAEPWHYQALQAAAWLSEVTGDLPKALVLARRLVDHFPDDVAGYWRMTSLLCGQDQYAEAEPYIRRAIELDPDDADLHHKLSLVLIDRLDWEEALDALERAAALEPEEPVYRFQLGAVLTRLGRAGDGAPHLLAALDLGADSAVAETMLTLLETYGLPAAVRPAYQRACELLHRPDLTVPGAAGDDKVLLQAQAEISERLAVPVGQDEETSRRSWELARVLAECVLAVQRRNHSARNTLKILKTHQDVPFALYSRPAAAREYGRQLTELGERFTSAGAALRANPDVAALNEVFTIAAQLLNTFQAAGMQGSTDEKEFTGIVLDMLEELQNQWRPNPREAIQAAQTFNACGLADAFPAFYRWLTTGTPAHSAHADPELRSPKPDRDFTTHHDGVVSAQRESDGHHTPRGLD